MNDRLAGLDISLLKAWLPQPVKDVVEAGMRSGAALTAPLRPVPDFYIVGTKRGGTTALWQLLLAHPQVMPMVPAAKNLKSTDWFFRPRGRGRSWYLGHFPTAAARQRHARLHGRAITGEASPMYLFDPRVPARVAAMAPRARIIVLLRDPVDRAWSHYRERVLNGTESLTFDEAIAAEDGRLAGEWERMLAEPGYYSRAVDWYSYRSRGVYLPQLQRWWQHFGHDQVLVLRSEDFYADPESTLVVVHRHLGIDPCPRVTPVDRNGAPTPATPKAMPSREIRERLREFYAADQAAISQF